VLSLDLSAEINLTSQNVFAEYNVVKRTKKFPKECGLKSLFRNKSKMQRCNLN